MGLQRVNMTEHYNDFSLSVTSLFIHSFIRWWVNKHILSICYILYIFPSGSDSKASVCNAGDPGSIPGLGRSPGEGHGSPLQYSCLENPMDPEPGRLPSMGSQRVGQDWAISLCTLYILYALCQMLEIQYQKKEASFLPLREYPTVIILLLVDWNSPYHLFPFLLPSAPHKIVSNKWFIITIVLKSGIKNINTKKKLSHCS